MSKEPMSNINKVVKYRWTNVTDVGETLHVTADLAAVHKAKLTALNNIEGITEVHLSDRYRLYFVKGALFSWDTIKPALLARLAKVLEATLEPADEPAITFTDRERNEGFVKVEYQTDPQARGPYDSTLVPCRLVEQLGVAAAFEKYTSVNKNFIKHWNASRACLYNKDGWLLNAFDLNFTPDELQNACVRVQYTGQGPYKNPAYKFIPCSMVKHWGTVSEAFEKHTGINPAFMGEISPLLYDAHGEEYPRGVVQGEKVPGSETVRIRITKDHNPNRITTSSHFPIDVLAVGEEYDAQDFGTLNGERHLRLFSGGFDTYLPPDIYEVVG